jgi:uncharacterized protein with GYD domain
MPKFLFEVSYTRDGLQGLLEKGGSTRRQASTSAVESAGGTVESFYFAFGERDLFVVADLPDNASAAAVALTVGASGAASCRTVALLTPEEIDTAAKRTVEYRPPGS